MAIFPTVTAGGLEARFTDGTCAIPALVENFYCFPAAFTADCDIRGLPSDCTARIEPRQINAIVSELMAFANQLNPTGTWVCENENNLAVNFAAFEARNSGDGITIGTDGPWSIIPAGVANAICADATAIATLQACLGIDALVGDGVTITTNAPFSVIPQGVAASICADPAATAILAACLLSTDAGQSLIIGTDGLIYAAGTAGDGLTITAAAPLAIIPNGVATAICADATARQTLAACLISGDAGNQLAAGTDGLLNVPAAAGGGVPAFLAVGSVVQGSLTLGTNIPAGGTINPGNAAGFINVNGANGGTQATINSGTWRYLGGNGTDQLWQRIA